MLRVLNVALITLLVLSGCSSTSTVSVNEEEYRGQLAAAVTPIAISGATILSAAERGRIQSQVVQQLVAADLFASVIPLASAGQSNEAEIIIDTSVIDAETGATGLERVTLRVRARRKGSSEIGIDDRYKGRASAKRNAVEDALKGLIPDLRRKYGDKPVY